MTFEAAREPAPAQRVAPAPPESPPPEPEFEVIGARSLKYAAVPTLEFDVQISEPSGRQVYLVALTTQVMIEPARRRYEPAEQERLVDLFGPPERWATTTRSLVWTIASQVVNGFTGSSTFQISVECSYDLEVAAAKYFHAVEDGEIPLAFNFNGTVYYRDTDGRLQMSLVPWSASAEHRMPIGVWKALVEHYFSDRAWVPVHRDTLSALQARRARDGQPTLDATVTDLLGEGE